MPEDSDTPLFVKKCVTSLVDEEGKDVSSAFAICVANFQNKGYLKKDSMEPTEKGKKRIKHHKGKENTSDSIDKYEKILKKAKGNRESRKDMLSFGSMEKRDPVMLFEKIDSVIKD